MARFVGRSSMAAGLLALSCTLSCNSDTVGVPALDSCSDAGHGSIGCSFSLTRLLHLRVNEKDADAILVSNPSTEVTTQVQLLRGDWGSERYELGPGEIYVFEFDSPAIAGESTAREPRAAMRVIAEDPVAAYLLAPYANRTSNDGSLLIPDAALGRRYVASSYSAFDNPSHPVVSGDPSYFMVVGQEDGTVVRFTPSVDTAGGDGIPAVAAGEQGEFVVDRDDAVRVAAIPFADISGTVIEADAPIWVAGAVGCAAVLDPDQTPSYCDHMQEVMRPIEQWGSEYVAVPAPRRAGEPHLWRIYAGAPQVSVSVDPPQPGFPLTLAQTGDRAELVVPNGTVLTITGDGPILPVQYVVSERLASGKGDSAMIQAVPRTAWLDRYVVGTGLRYSINYVQIVRPEGGAAVFVDGVEVVGYRSEQTVEIADWSVSEGTHVVTSAEPFGLSSYGYSNDVDGTKRSAYALPGGFSG